jgi:hypothetical protein
MVKKAIGSARPLEGELIIVGGVGCQGRIHRGHRRGAVDVGHADVDGPDPDGRDCRDGRAVLGHGRGGRRHDPEIHDAVLAEAAAVGGRDRDRRSGRAADRVHGFDHRCHVRQGVVAESEEREIGGVGVLIADLHLELLEIGRGSRRIGL